MSDEPEECGSALPVGEDGVMHECWEPKGHEGPHLCVACSEQW